MKRLAAALICSATLSVGMGSAMAGGNGASTSVVPVSFVNGAGLSSATCPNLPSGLTLSWSGPEKQITTARTDAGGVTTVSVVSHASGKATDQDGNLYAFDYSNHFRVSNTIAQPGLFAGTMTDHFSLAGHGLHLSNGFLASFETDLNTFFGNFQPINSRGDPISFPDGSAHCDPL